MYSVHTTILDNHIMYSIHTVHARLILTRLQHILQVFSLYIFTTITTTTKATTTTTTTTTKTIQSTTKTITRVCETAGHFKVQIATLSGHDSKRKISILYEGYEKKKKSKISFES